MIGAGVAGVTAPLALIGAGCTVDLFDGNHEPLVRQRNTQHRLIHPNINRWPEDGSTQPTTTLPFLDWYADKCNDTIELLLAKWKKAEKEFPDKLKFHKRHTIQDAFRQPGGRRFF